VTDASGPAQDDGRVRLLTYNVASAKRDRAALGRVVRAVAPDLVTVQEGPGRLRWRSAAARLARETALLWLGGGGPPAGTNVVLGHMRVDSVLTWSQRFPTPVGTPACGIAAGVFRVRGRPLGIAGVHLPPNPADRLRYAELLAVVVGELRSRAGAVVVAGDLNEVPGGPGWRRISELGLTDAATAAAGADAEPTFPARHSDRRLDAIWTSGSVEVLAVGVPGRSLRVPDVHADDLVVATDHLPVVADLRLTGPVAGRGSADRVERGSADRVERGSADRVGRGSADRTG